MKPNSSSDLPLEQELHQCAEEFYFWLMRSTSEPKKHSNTFQILSQIMRIAIVADRENGSYLTKEQGKEALQSLRSIKEQVKDGVLPIQDLSKHIVSILQKIIHENIRAELIAHATEMEYLFCINAPSHLSYHQTDDQSIFQRYLKALIESPLSEMQTKAIVQVMSQMLKEKDLDPSSGPSLKKSPYESLKEKVEKAGIPPFELSA